MKSCKESFYPKKEMVVSLFSPRKSKRSITIENTINSASKLFRFFILFLQWQDLCTLRMKATLSVFATQGSWLRTNVQGVKITITEETIILLRCALFTQNGIRSRGHNTKTQNTVVFVHNSTITTQFRLCLCRKPAARLAFRKRKQRRFHSDERQWF
jgi:hypothetical protein